MTYCETKTVRRNVFNCLSQFPTRPFGRFKFGASGLICALYMRQKCTISPLIYSFQFSITKTSGIPNLTIQWSNNTFNVFAASFLREG